MTIITPQGIQQEMSAKIEQRAQEEANAQAQYRQFLASLAFELYSNNVDPGMPEKAIVETANWALATASLFVTAVNEFELR